MRATTFVFFLAVAFLAGVALPLFVLGYSPSDEYTARIAGLDSAIVAHRDSLQASRVAVDEADRQVFSAHGRTEQALNALGRARTQAHELRTELDAHRARMLGANAELEDLRNRYEEALAIECEQCGTTVATEGQEISGLQEAVAARDREIELLQATIAELQEEVDLARGEVARASRRVALPWWRPVVTVGAGCSAGFEAGCGLAVAAGFPVWEWRR